MDAVDAEWFAKHGYKKSPQSSFLEKRLLQDPSKSSSSRPKLDRARGIPHPLNFPDDILVSIFHFVGDVSSIGRMGCVNLQLSEKVNSAEVWRTVMENCFWSKRIPSGGSFVRTQTSEICSKELVRIRAAVPLTLAIDIGRGYTKWALVHPLMPKVEGKLLQLCSSPTHPPEGKADTQVFTIQRCALDLILDARNEPSDPLHKAAVKITNTTQPSCLVASMKLIPCVVAVPFNVADARYPAIRMGIQRATSTSSVRTMLPQPVLCAMSLGLSNACVVNFGMAETVASYCTSGKLQHTEILPNGGSTLTLALLQVLIDKYNLNMAQDFMTRCRDLKEQHLEVSLRPLGGSIFHPVGCPDKEPIVVNFNGLEIALDTERWAIPEILFQHHATWSRQAGHVGPLVELILNVCNGDQEALDNIVLCGMTAKLPNLGERIEWELNQVPHVHARVKHVMPGLPLQAACLYAAQILPRMESE